MGLKMYDTNKVSKHHRKPISRGGKTTPQNLSMVSCVKHRAWHTLFANMSPPEIAEEINSVWLDPDFMLKALLKNPQHY
jgi:hypothetical protein